jgi:hypothetical protein
MSNQPLSAYPSVIGRWLAPTLLIILLGYTWVVILTSDVIATWRHWLALICTILVIWICVLRKINL